MVGQMLPGNFKTKHLSIFWHEACQRLIGSARVQHGKVAEEGEAGGTWGQHITAVYISVVWMVVRIKQRSE